jgi:hypothetical protein
MMEITASTNQAIPGLTEPHTTTYSTADSEHAVFYGPTHEWPSQEVAASLIVVAGDVYALDTETVPEGTPIRPDAGVTHLGDEDSSDPDSAQHS